MFPSFANEFKVPSDWIYRGEGNCNLVVSLPKERKILRIRKIKQSKSLLGWIINWITDILYWYCGNPFDDELRDLIFYKRIIRPLIGNNFVCGAEQVFLSRKEIRILEKQLYHQRPAYRRSKCMQYGRAALFNDYALLPVEYDSYTLPEEDTFAIEIKPKQGWVPFSERHFPKCTFCMNQYLKKEKSQIKSVSSYCPLDLFSGDPTKMTNALKSLVKNPQNNFRIFKNGRLCYGDDSNNDVFQNVLAEFFRNETETIQNLENEFYQLLQKCLLFNFEIATDANNCDKKLFCEWNKIIRENSIQSKLMKGSVLERILSVQMLDVEGIQYYYKSLKNKELGDFKYVKKLLKEISKNPQTCLKCSIMMLGDTDKRNNSLVYVPYLISAIAKDCSLMLTFKKANVASSDNFEIKNINTKYGNFVVNIGVFDLYPKPASTIMKHKKKFEKLMEIYNKMKNSNF